IGDIDCELTSIEDISNRGIHSTLWRVANAGLFPDFPELLPIIVEIELGDTVIVGNEQVRIAGATEVGGHGCERPTARFDSKLFAHLFETAIAEIVEQVLAPAVLRVLEALGHHSGVLETPKIDIL